MSNLKVKIKGRKNLTISANYNSLSTSYTQNKDDVKFGDGSNLFKDYLFTSSCGNWQDDKIILKALPDKGRLFYLTNPLDSVPVYADCFVGQAIIVRDILDNKVLKFQAEGSSDNQFTGTYITELKFERFCGNTSSNIMTYLTINMVDLQQLESTIYISDGVKDSEGNATFKLHVETATFNGFACSRLVATENIKNCNANYFGSFINSAELDLSLQSATVGQTIDKNIPISLPVGVYDLSISMVAVAVMSAQSYKADSFISFGPSQNYDSNPVNIYTSVDVVQE